MTDWYQQVLTPPSVIEIRVRYGIVPDADHLQVMVEAFDPVTKVQTAQYSVPHLTLRQWEEAVAWARAKATAIFDESVEPF